MRDDAARGRSRRSAAVVGGAALLACALVLGPVAGAPLEQAAGSPCSEASRHLWSLAVAGRSLRAGTGLRRVAEVGWPEGFSAPLLDPLSLLVFAPVDALFGPALAWNLLVMAAVAGAALGCWALVRVLRVGPAGAACLAVGVVLAPWLVQFPETGRSEYLAAALWPLHLAGLLKAHAGERRGLVLAALGLGAMGMAGPPLAVFVLLAELPLLLGLLWAQLRAARPVPAGSGLAPGVPAGGDAGAAGAGRLLGALVAGVALAAPALWSVVSELPAKAERWGPESPGLQEPVQTSLLSLLHAVPAALQPPTEQPATVALAVLALAAWAAWREPGARLWLALGVWVWVLAQGTAPTAALDVGALQQPAPWGPVAWLVRLVPPLGAVSSWSRIGCLLGTPVAIAAALGTRRGMHPLVVVALVVGVLEQVLSPRPPATSGRQVPVRPPAAYLSALEGLQPGPVLQLPMDLPGVGACVGRDRWLVWSLAHDRPVTTTPAEAADQGQYMGHLGAVLGRVQRGGVGPPRGPVPDARDCLREAAHTQHERGLAAVLVDTDDAVGRVQGAWLRAAWGPPAVVGARFQGWSLGEVPRPERRVPVCRLP